MATSDYFASARPTPLTEEEIKKWRSILREEWKRFWYEEFIPADQRPEWPNNVRKIEAEKFPCHGEWMTVPARDGYAIPVLVYKPKGTYSEKRPVYFQIHGSGCSSGGHLTIGTCMLAAERKEFSLRYQMLLYPGIDNYGIPDTTDDAIEANTMYINLYSDLEKTKNDPHVNPLTASDELLQQLPPALVLTAGADWLKGPADDEQRGAGELLVCGRSGSRLYHPPPRLLGRGTGAQGTAVHPGLLPAVPDVKPPILPGLWFFRRPDPGFSVMFDEIGR